MGCKYCAWACPYGAPQFNHFLGIMTKCNLCLDYLKEGKNPACVDACPMRAIEFGDIKLLEKKYFQTKDIYPLPPKQLTKPNLIITPHRDAGDIYDQDIQISNREEIS